MSSGLFAGVPAAVADAADADGAGNRKRLEPRLLESAERPQNRPLAEAPLSALLSGGGDRK